MIDNKALFNIGYGLYVVTTNDGKKDNGLIVNTVTQLTSTPLCVAVTVNKNNYSHDVIKQTGKMNVNTLTVEAPFKVFETFGFASGKDTDKFRSCSPGRSENGLVVLPHYINSYMSLEVRQYVDLGTHGMFICSVTEAKVVSETETMSYTYYHKNVKPKPKTEEKKGYICKICGYIHDEAELPPDFVCPICKHGAEDFEEIIEPPPSAAENKLEIQNQIQNQTGDAPEKQKKAPEAGPLRMSVADNLAEKNKVLQNKGVQQILEIFGGELVDIHVDRPRNQ